MSAQTKTDYLLERVAERLGVPKPAVDLVPSDPMAPLTLLGDLLALLKDPAAAEKRVDELKEKTAKATAASDQAKVDQATAAEALASVDAQLARARKAHDEQIASELAAHTVEMDKRRREIEAREQDLDRRAKLTSQAQDEADRLRADLKRRLAAMKAAAGD